MKSLRVLIVDDEPPARRKLVAMLKEERDLRIVGEAANGRDAAALIEEQEPDVVFLDVQMPGMDGFELCTKIRALPNHKNTPIIFVTSLTDFKSRARSSLSGGNDLIAKPFMFIELSVKALTYVLRGRLMKAKTPAPPMAAAA